MNRLRLRIATCLASLGWATLDQHPFPGIATREFDTAVGPKTASIQLQRIGDEAVLHAVYFSEGRNVASAVRHAPFTDFTTEAEIEKELHAFNAEVIDTVNQSYARRLHLSACVTA